MKERMSIRSWSIVAVSVASALILAMALILPHSATDTDSAARRVGRTLEKRMALLESYVDRPDETLPSDMVIYRYAGDSLKSWRNQFSVMNDDISPRTVVQRLTDLRGGMLSPLADVTDEPSFYSFGPCWYVARRVEDGDDICIIGLEIQNSLDERSFNGVNHRFHLSDRYSVKPLSVNGGSAVSIGGEDIFKVAYESLSPNAPANALLVWVVVMLFMVACLLYVLENKTVRSALLSISGVMVSLLATYFWGMHAQDDYPLFSPTLYSGSRLMYSLGASVIVNLAIMLTVWSIYFARKDLRKKMKSRTALLIGGAVDVAAILAILLYAHFALESIVLNSSISLELYKIDELSRYTLIVYMSFILLLASVTMLLQLLQPVLSRFLGFHFSAFSPKSRMVEALLIALYIVQVGTYHGFEKEQQRLALWANRLSVDRDVTVELQLRRADAAIAGDAIISSLLSLDGTEAIIENLIADNHLRAIMQDYKVTVRLLRDARPDPEVLDRINARLRDGQPIVEGAHFIYVERPDGRAVYDGVFLFFNEAAGLTRMLVEVTPRAMNSDRGYQALLGGTQNGRLSIPSYYSYARYRGDDLLLFRGKFAYPTKLPQYVRGKLAGTVSTDGYMHFVSSISDDESVVISRPKIAILNYVVECVFLALVAYLILSILAFRKHRRKVFETSYYKPRIAWVLMVSLVITLVAMATASVIFVYDRNEDNLRDIMSDKINSVQALILEGLRQQGRPNNPAAMAMVLKTVSENTGSDITLYGPDGRVRMSTVPEVFDRMLLGSRIDAEAYDNIINGSKRYYIHRETLQRRRYYSMYAPLVDPEGRIAAIICVPFTDGNADFEKDAFMHLITIMTIFLILALLARFMSTAVVDMMFKPLLEMSRKMKAADLDSLEYIEYDREDEIRTLVKAYNGMVTELSENSKMLAQAERDKAWSGMARQVAHEIKNPLTPMKLQIQRIIRLKERNAPNWEEKFDEVSGILLDQIDILSDTANEFSTFAKLYTEEPVDINLDQMLQEEITMFDNKDGLTIDYYGLSDARTSGPKPQLTRVFWNLLGNACQAIEDRPDGHIVVSLRNSSRDGWYDIVFEDNGPGVSEENVEKLFTPNFTTKSSGSGLGLAMSRSILEKCGAEISYSRSFTLGGACFTINYPK